MTKASNRYVESYLYRKTKREHDRDSKLDEAKRVESIRCECGCRVYYSWFNEKGWTVCRNCKKKVAKPREEFKNTLRKLLG